MADAVSSSVDPPKVVSDHGDIPPEDRQAMERLLVTCPKLKDSFQCIVRVVELMTTRTRADKEVCGSLKKMDSFLMARLEQSGDLINFATVSGFVEKGVPFGRQILRDMGTTYVTEWPRVIDSSVDDETACLYFVRNIILNCSNNSSEFSLRLSRTGYLQDLLEDVKHIQHLSVEALERGNVLLLSLGTILNCCRYPESAAAVRELDIAPHVTPFLTKRGRSHLVQTTAMAVLANVLDEDELDLLALDGDLLQYSLNNIMGALSTNTKTCDHWLPSEILFNLWLWAINDINKHLTVAQGTLHILHDVLTPSKKRSEEEKKNAVVLISRLMEDEVNLQICQNYPELIEVLKDFGRNGARETVEKVRDVLGKLERHNGEDLDDRIPAFPHVAQLLADQYNLPSILNVGLVEFVLDELKTFAGEQGTKAAAHRDEASCQQVLLALTELADDHVCRREIMSRGGLAVLKTVLQTGSSEEKTEAAKAVLGLTMAPENRQVVKINTDLTTLLEDAKERADNPDLAQLADTILVALHQ